MVVDAAPAAVGIAGNDNITISFGIRAIADCTTAGLLSLSSGYSSYSKLPQKTEFDKNAGNFRIMGDKSPYLKKYPRLTDENWYFYNSIAKTDKNVDG